MTAGAFTGAPLARSLRYYPIVVLACAGAAPLEAQVAARYLPATDTLRYLSENTYRMFFVRGSDTLGTPATTRTSETRTVAADPRGLAMRVRLESVDGTPFSRDETYTVSSDGRLLAVGGRPAASVHGARVDLLPRLPRRARALVAGLTWTDTVSATGREPYGDTAYDVTRRYLVRRVFDSTGVALAELAAEGTMHLRQGGWADQAQTQAWWQDVSGSVTETVLFDLRRGAVWSSRSVMLLRGTGGATGAPSMPSGLNSTVTLTRR